MTFTKVEQQILTEDLAFKSALSRVPTALMPWLCLSGARLQSALALIDLSLKTASACVSENNTDYDVHLLYTQGSLDSFISSLHRF